MSDKTNKWGLTLYDDIYIYIAIVTDAPVVKLAYTLDSGSSGFTAVEVRILSGAPLIVPLSERFFFTLK